MAGSHKRRSKQTDGARRENEKVNPVKDAEQEVVGLSLVYQCGLPGPHLDCLVDVGSPKAHRALEARIRNRRGVLPTSLIVEQKSHQTAQVDDPWLREVFCILTRVQNGNKHPTYLAQFFIKSADLHRNEAVQCPQAERSTRLQALEVDLEGSLGDEPSHIDSTGVRGHARGLVSRVMIDRLDGTTSYRPFLLGTKVEPIRGTRVELCMLRSTSKTHPEGVSDLSHTHLRTIEADCIHAVMRRIFHRAKALDHLLLDSLVEQGSVAPVPRENPSSKEHMSHVLEPERKPFPVPEDEDPQLSDTKTAAHGFGDVTQLAHTTTPTEFVSGSSTVIEKYIGNEVNEKLLPRYVWENGSEVEARPSLPVDKAESRLGKAGCSLTSNPLLKDRALPQKIPTTTPKSDTQKPCSEREALLKYATRNFAQNTSTNNNIKWTSEPDKTKPALTKQVGTFLFGLICCMSVRKR